MVIFIRLTFKNKSKYIYKEGFILIWSYSQALKTYLVVGLTLLHLSSAEKDPAAFVKSLTSNCREIGWEPTCERKARNSNDNNLYSFCHKLLSFHIYLFKVPCSTKLFSLYYLFLKGSLNIWIFVRNIKYYHFDQVFQSFSCINQ